MRKLLIALALVAGPAMADLTVGNGDGRIVLHENKPCDVPELVADVPTEMLDMVHSGFLEVRGHITKLCWVRNGDMAIVKDEDGNGGLVDLSAFKQVQWVSQ